MLDIIMDVSRQQEDLSYQKPKGRDHMNLLTFLFRLFFALAHAKEAADVSGAPDGEYRIYNDKKSIYDASTVDTQSAAPPGWDGAPPYRYIDVSRYQGKITLDGWRKIKAAGYKGVMLKTVSTNSKLSKRKDGLYVDPKFETNYRNARAAGLDVGVYYYTYATSEAMADAELALVRQAVYGKELTMPLAVDVEENKLKPMSTLDLTNLTAYALEQVEKMGFYAQLYTYTGYKYELDMARLSSRWDVWLADYTGKTPKVNFKYNAHQHTSKGNVPGIMGNVDLNVTTLNYPRIIRKKGLTRLREGK